MASPAPTWPTHPPPPSRFSRPAPGYSPLSSSLHPHAHSDVQSQYFAYPTPSLHSEYVLPPRRVRCMTHLRPWLPLIAYLATTLAFVVAFAFWRTELFQGLDDLSRWLKEDYYGYAALFFLIFATCFPPIPLYSTLIVLSGYTFGAEEGAVLSYCAALSGAVVVFLLSRYVCKDIISRWLASVRSIGRVCRAIEKRPALLFLIRLAPYPYNVMNCLLAASPTLSFRTYVSCTALSLFKVYIHTYLGASIHSFAEYHAHASEHGKQDESPLGMYYTVGGVALCVGIIIYLAIVARRAVDCELDGEDELPTHTAEETASFLAHTEECDDDAAPAHMTERAVTPIASTVKGENIV
ncbi:hypothetical protein PENSPDRAFT_581469 [Peniophora sp. CONT]|nr:hypothetical protein PENSPDRAFT_581469 [Peniophora sp. CONT]